MPKTTLVRAKSKEGDSGGVGAAGEGGKEGGRDGAEYGRARGEKRRRRRRRMGRREVPLRLDGSKRTVMEVGRG